MALTHGCSSPNARVFLRLTHILNYTTQRLATRGGSQGQQDDAVETKTGHFECNRDFATVTRFRLVARGEATRRPFGVRQGLLRFFSGSYAASPSEPGPGVV
jgi:hypothetical protein